MARSAPPPLAGRVALVTGGARRVGAAIVRALAAAGADVVVHARTSGPAARALARAVRAQGRRAAVLLGDLEDDVVARALPDAVVDALGRLDVLVHNAGRFAPADPCPRDPADLDVAAWDAAMNLHARAAWLLTAAAARHLARRRGAAVHVACASAASPWPGFVPYSASKAALVAVVRGYAKALAPRVRVNAVAPGPVLPPEGADATAAVAATTWLARWGRPADVAGAVVYLATAPYVTGVVLPVDGGRHLRG